MRYHNPIMRSPDKNVIVSATILCIFVIYMLVLIRPTQKNALDNTRQKHTLTTIYQEPTPRAVLKFTPSTPHPTIQPDIVREQIIWGPEECKTTPTFYNPNTKYGYWWRKLNKWEVYKQDLWCNRITPETTYVGFGAWIGPTAFLAASLGASVIALEPDPTAMKEFMANINVNPDIDIYVSNLCIAEEKKSLKMAVHGGSESVVANVKQNFDKRAPNSRIIDVECITLPEAIEMYKVPMDEHVFIKCDTEGGERFLIPAIATWLGGFIVKPDMAISYHPKHSGITKEENELHCRILNTYAYKYFTKWGGDEFVKVDELTEDMLTTLTDVFVSDRR